MADPKRPGGPPPRERNVTRKGYANPSAPIFNDDEPTEMNFAGPPPEQYPGHPSQPQPHVQAQPQPSRPPRPRSEQPPPMRYRSQPPPPALPQSGVEVELVQESGPMSQRRGTWRAMEIWTKNRIYSLDSRMNCFEVIDRESGRPDPEHSFVGARLGGGQRKEGAHLRLSHPFPVPGTEAVFRLPAGRQGRFGQTSKVERVVLRVRVATVPILEAEPLWEEMTGRWSIPEQGGPPRR